MLAITVKPQWAYAMLHLGKRLENRDFFPDGLVGQRIALHAGRGLTGPTSLARAYRDLAFMLTRCGYPAMPIWFKGSEPRLFWHTTSAWAYDPATFERERAEDEWKFRRFAGEEITIDQLPRSCIFATAVLQRGDHIEAVDRRMWGEMGKKHWHLTAFERLPTPVPYGRGQLGIYLLPRDIEEQVNQARYALTAQRGWGAVPPTREEK